MEQLVGGEQRLEGEHIQWHSWIRERTSVHSSPILEETLETQPWPGLHWTTSWPSALAKALLGIFHPPSLLSTDLNPPNPCFAF